ncbi:GNAT family N-acetyltransferase [Polycladidibacter stylochi]|uniref:GNAT family N-acetyltransferase n=1 Tax=Polycladidibacter stylochi TaxID=1807766 RepID=UPI00082C776E|nr:GNAT family N-acetyltransferase [Pseudovibrio stylochi]
MASTSKTQWQWQPMQAQHLPQVIAMMAAIYPDLPEDKASIERKLQLYPKGCKVLCASEQDEIVGYMLSHPWKIGCIPNLNRRIDAIPVKPDCYFLHDLALAPKIRGQGAAKQAISHVMALAQNEQLDLIALVSVEQAVPFWFNQGFKTATAMGLVPTLVDNPQFQQKLATYGSEARYLLHPVI